MSNTPDILVTAGATRNPIDAVRFLSARSSGSTGAFLAESFYDKKFNVTLLGSAEACLRTKKPLHCIEYGSTRDLLVKVQNWTQSHPNGVIIHASAVGDYELVNQQGLKIPSGQATLQLTLTPTPKIASLIRTWGFTGTLVTFKAASPDLEMTALIDIAMRQRERTGSDFVFANVLGRLDSLVAIVGQEVQPFTNRERALDALVSHVCARVTRRSTQ